MKSTRQPHVRLPGKQQTHQRDYHRRQHSYRLLMTPINESTDMLTPTCSLIGRFSPVNSRKQATLCCSSGWRSSRLPRFSTLTTHKPMRQHQSRHVSRASTSLKKHLQNSQDSIGVYTRPTSKDTYTILKTGAKSSRSETRGN